MITCFFENGKQADKLGLRHVTTSVIMVNDKGEIMLGLRQLVPGRDMLEVGKWALLGGFFDRGENILECVRREVMEESGWEIEDLKLFRIVGRPDRPHEDRQNMDMVFVARAVQKSAHHDKEMQELKWFPLGALPDDEQIAFDHAEDLLLYKKYLTSTHPLPLLA